ncbi:MAG: hypothetical protein K2X87_32355 [Gemmataceae bacterium]|nr:hypothetical protein [Gemmataceae bacterium]
MNDVLTNPFFLVFAFLTLSNVAIAAGYYWYRARKAELDANLKHEMLQRGMSAEDIRQVLAAPVKPRKPAVAATSDAEPGAAPDTGRHDGSQKS